MKQTLKILLSLIVILCVFVSISISTSAATVVESGTCGENLTWTLDDNGVLRISGTGDMEYYQYRSNVPWDSLRNNITSVDIEYGVTDIGDWVFGNCTNLTSIAIPNSVTSIGNYAFFGCTSLSSITIPNSVTSIGQYAFRYCVFTDITIPDSVTDIHNHAFLDCANLQTLTVGENVTYLGSSVFGACTNLETVYWNAKDASTYTYDYDIFGKAGIDGPGISFVFGDTVEKIPGRLFLVDFYQKPKIREITIGENVTSIDPLAFSNCVYVEKVYWNARNVSDFTEDSNRFAKFGISGSGFEIVFGDTVERIPAYLFATSDYSNRPKVTSVTIGENVKSIGMYAFENCENLTSITVPINVTRVESVAFGGCTGLKKIYWNARNVSSLGSSVFSKAGTSGDGIEVVFGDTVEQLPSGLFSEFYTSDAPKVTKVVIGNNVTEIPDSAFYWCYSLESITIPNNVTRIGHSAFSESGLKTITIPENVEFIGNHAFYECYSLEKVYWNAKNVSDFDISSEVFYNGGSYGDGIDVVFGDTVERIPAYAFCYSNDNYSKSKVKSVSIGENVESIGYNAFAFCTTIEKVSIKNLESWCGFDFNKSYFGTTDNPIEYAGNLYINGELATEIIIPDSVTKIGDYAFYGCETLEKITIHDNVTSIGRSAFWGTGYSANDDNWDGDVLYIDNHLIDTSGDVDFNSCTIKDGTKTIAGYAFSSSYIRSVTIPDSVVSIGADAFFYCYDLNYIYISNLSSWCNIDFANSYSVPTGKMYVNGESLTRIIIPDGVETIPAYTIENLVRYGWYSSLVIPDSVKNIGDYNLISNPNYFDYYIFYAGSESMWEEITIGDTGNDYLVDGIIHYNSTDHTGGDWIVEEPADCGWGGSKYKVCTVCGCVFEWGTIPPTGEHTPSDWIIDTPATAGAPGSKHKECTVCGETLETVAIPQLKPATPKATTENALTGVLVKWNAVEGATKYNVYRRQGGSNTWTLVGTTTGTSLTDTNVSSGIYYVYSVRAYNNIGLYSDFVSANTQTRKYMAVPKLTGISNATNGLYIKWNPVAGVTNGYRVYRRGAGSTYWTYLGTVKTTYFTDTSVKARSGEYFRYTVIADGGYHSKFDTTGLYLKRLANPALKSAVSSKTGITVKWDAVMGTTGYYVYRKTANSGWVRIAAVGGTNNTSYVDKTAQKGVTYTYTVRAVYGATTSYFNSGISCKDRY